MPAGVLFGSGGTELAAGRLVIFGFEWGAPGVILSHLEVFLAFSIRARPGFGRLFPLTFLLAIGALRFIRIAFLTMVFTLSWIIHSHPECRLTSFTRVIPIYVVPIAVPHYSDFRPHHDAVRTPFIYCIPLPNDPLPTFPPFSLQFFSHTRTRSLPTPSHSSCLLLIVFNMPSPHFSLGRLYSHSLP